ncbi:MAG: ATP-binding protein [Ekhidna sp.]
MIFYFSFFVVFAASAQVDKPLLHIVQSEDGEALTSMIEEHQDVFSTQLNSLVDDEFLVALLELIEDFAEYQPEKSIYATKEILSLKAEDSASFIFLYSNLILGASHYRMGNYQEGLSSFISILELTGVENYLEVHLEALSYTAFIYYELEDYNEAIRYGETIITLLEQTKNDEALGNTYLNLALPHTGLEEFDIAISYLNKALDIGEEVGDDELISNTLGNLAFIYLGLGDFEKGLAYQKRGLALEELRGDSIAMIDSYGVLTYSYSLLGNLDQVDIYFEKTLTLAIRLKQKSKLLDTYILGSEMFADLDNYERAYELSVLHRELYDSLLGMEKNERVAEMREKYETAEKENQIDSLEKDKQFALAIIVIVIIIAASLIFFFLQAQLQKRRLQKSNELITSINKRLNQSQDELIKSNRTKDKFFALVAHDLRGPITSFQGVGRILAYAMEKGGQERVQELIQTIDESASGINALLDNLLKWSLSQTDAIPFNPEPINLYVLVEEVVMIYHQSLEAKSISIDYGINKELFVEADGNMLSSVLRNLIGNAIKFTPDEGKIEIESELKEEIWVSVKDTGIGMDGEKLSQIFRLDENKSTSGTRGEKGTGLGLVLCKEFIEANKGVITINSKVDSGTVVAFSLPVLKGK